MRLTAIKARRINGNGIIHAVASGGQRKLSLHAGNTTLTSQRRAEPVAWDGAPVLRACRKAGTPGPRNLWCYFRLRWPRKPGWKCTAFSFYNTPPTTTTPPPPGQRVNQVNQTLLPVAASCCHDNYMQSDWWGGGGLTCTCHIHRTRGASHGVCGAQKMGHLHEINGGVC